LTSGRTLITLAWELFFILVGGAWVYGEDMGISKP
jgi:hypothetical protein